MPHNYAVIKEAVDNNRKWAWLGGDRPRCTEGHRYPGGNGKNGLGGQGGGGGGFGADSGVS